MQEKLNLSRKKNKVKQNILYRNKQFDWKTFHIYVQLERKLFLSPKIGKVSKLCLVKYIIAFKKIANMVGILAISI